MINQRMNVNTHRVLGRILGRFLETVLEAGEACPDLVQDLVVLDVLVVVGVEVLLVPGPLLAIRDRSVAPENITWLSKSNVFKYICIVYIFNRQSFSEGKG